jgi:hypothetical protein
MLESNPDIDYSIVPIDTLIQPEENNECFDESTDFNEIAGHKTTEKERYMQIFHLGKQLAALGARNEDRTTNIIQELNCMIHSCLSEDTNVDNIINEDTVPDVCDAIGHKPGRPKIAKLKGMKRSSEKVIKQSHRCSRCGKTGHNTRNCKKTSDLDE